MHVIEIIEEQKLASHDEPQSSWESLWSKKYLKKFAIFQKVRLESRARYNMKRWYKNCPIVTLMREIEKKRIISKVLKENCGSTQVIWSTYQLGTEYSDRHKRDIMWPRTLEQVIWGKFSSFFWDYLWHLKNAPMFGISGFCQWWNSKQKSRQNTFNLSIGFIPQKKKFTTIY